MLEKPVRDEGDVHVIIKMISRLYRRYEQANYSLYKFLHFELNHVQFQFSDPYGLLTSSFTIKGALISYHKDYIRELQRTQMQ